MIIEDKYGMCGYVFHCPACGKEHGNYIHHIIEQLPILCNECLNNDATDITLKVKTLIFYVEGLQKSVNGISGITSGFRVIR
jgi:hypothetical protein